MYTGCSETTLIYVFHEIPFKKIRENRIDHRGYTNAYFRRYRVPKLWENEIQSLIIPIPLRKDKGDIFMLLLMHKLIYMMSPSKT